MVHANYLTVLFDEKVCRSGLRKAKVTIEESKVKFNALLVPEGLSGIFGAMLAHRLKKRLVIVRKKDVSTHSAYAVENFDKSEKLNFLFVDDLISDGGTVNWCWDSIRKHKKTTLMGAYLYNSDLFKTAKYLKLQYGVKL